MSYGAGGSRIAMRDRSSSGVADKYAQEAPVRKNPNLGRDLGWGLVSVKGKYLKDANSYYRLRSGKVNTQRPLSQSARSALRSKENPTPEDVREPVRSSPGWCFDLAGSRGRYES